MNDLGRQRANSRGRHAAPPPHARGAAALDARSAPRCRPRATCAPPGERIPASGVLARHHRRQSLHRAFHPHARVVRARRQAPGRARSSISRCSSPRAPRARACSIPFTRSQALHADVLVIREAEVGRTSGSWQTTSPPHVSVLSAGEAHIAHPTQGLLDALTVRQRKQQLRESLSIAIVGDIRHSRVARSAYHAFRALGVPELRIVAPPAFMPEADEFVRLPRAIGTLQARDSRMSTSS
jgi:hypothetical protein